MANIPGTSADHAGRALVPVVLEMMKLAQPGVSTPHLRGQPVLRH